MRILTIGGTGNISRWFVQMLADQGHDCTVYNRGRRRVRFSESVRQLAGDRTDQASFLRDMKALPPFDCVIDMVAYEPAEMEVAIRAFSGRTGQYIFCSTVDVYSKPQPVYPVPMEGKLGPSPDFSYAWKKWEMEGLLRAAGKQLPFTVIRPGATYSEGWSPLITSFGGDTVWLRRLREGRRMILHGDGSVLWSMAHSEDVAKAFIGAAGNPTALGQSYNVTGEEWLTWETMHRIVAGELGAPPPRFEYVTTAELVELAPEHVQWCLLNFQFNSLYDNNKAKEELGFRYTIPYREGVRRCLNAIPEDRTTEPPFFEELLDRLDSVRTVRNQC